ncbi:hypothetical protein EOI86_23095 [Hwanghaeella grinnelliae]|uniref:Uncharacterized protein n=1 Tax=Hwanghaeella grinnelliae TaxID=2500179 RepID=A0A3S3ULE4_9PROT|nr:hypothetical protein [Hwanghaeella grinnelliae]RVU34011.1 hypothetical protein EOI86_23095 [Hwanghaeella grinnelliae]
MKNSANWLERRPKKRPRPARPDTAKLFLLKMLVMAAIDEDSPLQDKLAEHFAGWLHDPDAAALIDNAALFDSAVADLKRKVGSG